MNLFNKRASGSESYNMTRHEDRLIPDRRIFTVGGLINSADLGVTLVHEHALVDFIGADKIRPDRWDRHEVVKKVLPFFVEAKDRGVKTIFDCTPAFLGRDPEMLRSLSAESGVQIVTNTGYYGAGRNKYLPAWVESETAEGLSRGWVREFQTGIDGTDIRPGFIKIGVDWDVPLSDVHRTLVRAAALTHLKTGLTICSHTGMGTIAFEEIDILKKTNVDPSAFVWVHAQVETDRNLHVSAAALGAWVSLDGIGWGDIDGYADSIQNLKEAGFLHRVLISHDAGWYKPDEPDGEFVGYTAIFDELLPKLRTRGFSEEDIDSLLIVNPGEAMGMGVRAG